MKEVFEVFFSGKPAQVQCPANKADPISQLRCYGRKAEANLSTVLLLFLIQAICESEDGEAEAEGVA